MKFSQQDIDRLKQISCVEYLSSRGHKPRSTRGRTYKYMAPWRAENVPSVCIYLESNSFVDFGNREIGGSVIQLAMALEGVSFGKACEILNGGKLPERKIEPPKIIENPIKILYTCDIKSAWLQQFLSKRCVPLWVANKYCVQARIEMKDDEGVAYRKTCIAWENSRGGYDFRNERTKISNSPKIYTKINPGHNEVYLFEGMFDFMSWVSWTGEPVGAEIVVLNSIVFISYIDFSVYDAIHYVCDNDVAGDSWFEKIEHHNKIDERGFFKPFKDVNEWWANKCTRKNTLYQKELMQIL